MSSSAQAMTFPPCPLLFESVEDVRGEQQPCQDVMEKGDSALNLDGKSVQQLGSLVLQRLMEVASLRSQTTGGGDSALFPLPTSIDVLRTLWTNIDPEVLNWIVCVCLGLNSLWGGECLGEKVLGSKQRVCLDRIRNDVERFCSLGLKTSGVDWQEFFTVRGIDYKGDEVKVARWIKWENVSPALPKEIGRVPLEEVCSLGCRNYILSLDSYLKSPENWGVIKRSKCTGLLRAGVCCLLEEEQVFHTGSGPLLNGLFGVSKEEWTPEGVEIMKVPECWSKFLAFNKPVPSDILPEDLQGKTVYLASRVLPTGFLNSVSIAQNVHRNLVKWSYGLEERPALESTELRKDRPFAAAESTWRVYLDNYDLLEKVTATGMIDQEGTVADQILALRQEYLVGP